ncbi:MAG: protein ImuB [Parasphingorhabdus sp.]|jgi:protein ImuB
MSLHQATPLKVATQPAAESPAAIPLVKQSTALWLGLHFSSLPLIAVSNDNESACAVYQPRHQNNVVIAVNHLASAAGIRPGMTLKEAWMLSPALVTCIRDPEQEQILLQSLAESLLPFSSLISEAGPADLVIEIGGSRRLFGGIRQLITQVGAALELVCRDFNWAITPTPASASLCAQAKISICETESRQLRSLLGNIPLQHLDVDDKTATTLRNMGIGVLRQLFRLPRSGLHKRFGVKFIHQLERILGERPDPRHAYQPEEHFHQHLKLDEESGNLQQIGQITRHLCQQLQQFLITRNSVVESINWQLWQANNSIEFSMRLGSATDRADYVHQLTDLKLQRLQLSAPIRSITLASDTISPNPGGNLELFSRQSSALQETHHMFMDRMRCRLGRDAVHGLDLTEEYRPEKSWRLCLPGHTGKTLPEGHARPAWILSQPIELNCHKGNPVLHGSLQLEPERERIVSGWWDYESVTRDYRQATDLNGRRLWIYQELKSRRWYLHGIY